MHSCCFTGHRIIAQSEIPLIKQRLENTIDSLIHRGVFYFFCGGAIGFDMLAGFTILDFKAKNASIKLTMVLPCRNQDAQWREEEKEAYRNLLAAADETVYISENYRNGCMQKRNIHLVQNSDICVSYLKYGRSGTAQTVRLAKERGIKVLNLADL